jgi:uncharacterized membrane protein YkoI
MHKFALFAPLALLAIATPTIARNPAVAPRITKEAATRTALAAVPGGVVESGELENEHHRLVYSFDIRVPGKSGVEEIQVSAINGRIVSRKHESPAKEAIEKAVDPH